MKLNQIQYHDAVERSEEHTSELQSHSDLVCRLLLEKKKRECSGADAIRDQERVRLQGLGAPHVDEQVRTHADNSTGIEAAPDEPSRHVQALRCCIT